MRLRYDEATDSVVVVEETRSAGPASPHKADINPQPSEIVGGRFLYDDDFGVYSPGDNYFEPKPAGPQIMRDIEGYKTVAGDIANDGKRIHIGSRSRHREFLRDNGYVEVGNDYDKRQVDDCQPRQESRKMFLERRQRRVEAIKHAVDLVRTGRVREHFNVDGRD